MAVGALLHQNSWAYCPSIPQANTHTKTALFSPVLVLESLSHWQPGGAWTMVHSRATRDSHIQSVLAHHLPTEREPTTRATIKWFIFSSRNKTVLSAVWFIVTNLLCICAELIVTFEEHFLIFIITPGSLSNKSC